jgi:hypothetical protein
VPDKYYLLLDSILKAAPDIHVNEGENDGDVFSAKEQPDLSIFDRNEIDTISLVDNYFKDFPSYKIKNFSHKEKGYIATKDGDLIDYEYAAELQI